jgi:hypothetical protein
VPVLGAAVGGALLLGIMFSPANLIVQIVQVYLPFAFSTVGAALHIHALETFATGALGHKLDWVIAGIVITALYAAISLRPVKVVGKWDLLVHAHWSHPGPAHSIARIFETRTGFIHAFNAASGGKNAYTRSSPRRRHRAISEAPRSANLRQRHRLVGPTFPREACTLSAAPQTCLTACNRWIVC